MGTTLLCAIYGAIVENTLFEDGDAANIFCAFNPTQVFLHLKKKLLLSCYGARAICYLLYYYGIIIFENIF